MGQAGPLLALALLGALSCGEGAPAAVARSTRPLAPELRAVARAVEQQQFELARELAQRFVDAHPQDGQGLYILGMTHYWSGNFGAARAWLEQALAREPGITIAHESLGYCLFMLGELDGARREYEAYVALAPGEPKGHYGLGLIELEETRLTQAQACFRRAIELHAEPESARLPELAECHARLGEVHFARGEYEAARSELLRAVQLCPGNISAFYTLSLVHRRLGQDPLADAAAERFESARRALSSAPGARRE